MHSENQFITLTYSDSHLPYDNSLNKKHFQDFMKRYRKHTWRHDSGQKIRYFQCGEYGSEDHTKRPHYHALIFGHRFRDEKLYKVHNDNNLYTSDILTDLWGMGHAITGDLTWESAAYCARYSLKKLNGAKLYEEDPATGLLPYERLHRDTGNIVEVQPEYATQSRRPGIGKNFLAEYQTDIYPFDEVIINGHPTKPPRYYDEIYARTNPESMETIKNNRVHNGEKRAADNTRARLREREKVKLAQTQLLKRGIQYET